MYDGLDVSVTSNVTWFHLNHDMVSRRSYKLSIYGEHSITTFIFYQISVSVPQVISKPPQKQQWLVHPPTAVARECQKRVSKGSAPCVLKLLPHHAASMVGKQCVTR